MAVIATDALVMLLPVAGPSNIGPRRAQFRGEKFPAYNASSDDWGHICPRSRLDPLFGLCVCKVRTPPPMGARHTWGRDVRVASPVNRDHTREHKRKSEFCFAVGNETRNPPGRGRNPIKRWRVAYAQVAKKPNRKSGCVNRPADALGIRHPTSALGFLPVKAFHNLVSILCGAELRRPWKTMDRTSAGWGLHFAPARASRKAPGGPPSRSPRITKYQALVEKDSSVPSLQPAH